MGRHMNAVDEHWCVATFAWAGAAWRDPVHAEGMQIVCEATSSTVRGSYEHFQRYQEIRDLDLLGFSNFEPEYAEEAEYALRKLEEMCGSSARRDVRNIRTGSVFVDQFFLTCLGASLLTSLL